MIYAAEARYTNIHTPADGQRASGAGRRKELVGDLCYCREKLEEVAKLFRAILDSVAGFAS
mgnify:CR=1 FL=1